MIFITYNTKPLLLTNSMFCEIFNILTQKCSTNLMHSVPLFKLRYLSNTTFHCLVNMRLQILTTVDMKTGAYCFLRCDML